MISVTPSITYLDITKCQLGCPALALLTDALAVHPKFKTLIMVDS